MTQALANRTWPMMIQAVLITISSAPLYFLDSETKWPIYPCAAVQGVGTAIFLNTSTSIISDVIGDDNTASAFVYGVYSLMDKVANGILIAILVAEYSTKARELRWIISTLPTLSAISGLICTYIATKYYSSRLAKMSLGSKFKRTLENDKGTTDSLVPTGKPLETVEHY